MRQRRNPAKKDASRRLANPRRRPLNGSLRGVARRHLGPGARLMPAAERRAQIREILARAPRPGRVWVFGYGSLMWNPALR